MPISNPKNVDIKGRLYKRETYAVINNEATTMRNKKE